MRAAATAGSHGTVPMAFTFSWLHSRTSSLAFEGPFAIISGMEIWGGDPADHHNNPDQILLLASALQLCTSTGCTDWGWGLVAAKLGASLMLVMVGTLSQGSKRHTASQWGHLQLGNLSEYLLMITHSMPLLNEVELVDTIKTAWWLIS